MHELALAEAVVAIAGQHARGRRVARVELRVGRLRQVVSDALTFSFELAAQGTVVEAAELALEEVPVRLACRACGSSSLIEDLPLGCRSCGSFDVEVASGEEFQVVALELEGELVAAARR